MVAAGSSREEGCMLGYLASQPEAAVVCGVVSEPEERSSGGLDGVWETFQGGGDVFIEADASPHWSHSIH